jgi:predicted AAA+ superfamily ATPase
MRQVSESLTGRASYLTLWPMTRREQRGLGRCGLRDELHNTPDAEWREILAGEKDSAEDWRMHRWLNLQETSNLLVRLPAYAVNRTKRLIKAPKIYWGDTGLALHLAETEAMFAFVQTDGLARASFCGV